MSERERKGDLDYMSGRSVLLRGRWGPGTAAWRSCGAPSLQALRARLDGALGSLSCWVQPCPWQGVGAGWALRALPTQTVLWFYEEYCFCPCPGWLTAAHSAVLILHEVPTEFQPSVVLHWKSSAGSLLGELGKWFPVAVTWLLGCCKHFAKSQGRKGLNLCCCFFSDRNSFARPKPKDKWHYNIENCLMSVFKKIIKIELETFHAQNIFFLNYFLFF